MWEEINKKKAERKLVEAARTKFIDQCKVKIVKLMLEDKPGMWVTLNTMETSLDNALLGLGMEILRDSEIDELEYLIRGCGYYSNDGCIFTKGGR